jgi:phosphatidylglycerophosphate synthase
MDQAPARERPVTLNVPDHPVINRPDREAADAVDTVDADVEGARPRGRAEPGDGLVAAYVTGPCAAVVARWAAERGITAGAVSASSLALAGLAAVWFSAGARSGLVAGALLLTASLVLGQAGAGLGRRASPFAVRPDAVLDRVGELAVYAGLAAGAVASGESAWWPAVGAAALLSVRHTVSASYAAGRHPRRARPARRGRPLRGGAARRAAKSLRLPLGERFALIALTAALADARLTFAALLAWGAAAAALTLGGRVARSLAP